MPSSAPHFFKTGRFRNLPGLLPGNIVEESRSDPLHHIVAATQVLPPLPGRWDGPLAGQLQQPDLDRSSVEAKVQLHDDRDDPDRHQGLFRPPAVGAVRLAEEDHAGSGRGQGALDRIHCLGLGRSGSPGTAKAHSSFG